MAKLDGFETIKRIKVEQLKKADIFASTADGATSTVIKIFTSAKVSHTSMYVGNNQIVEAEGAGVQITPLAEAYRDNTFMLVFRHTRMNPIDAGRIASYALKQVGCAYNLEGGYNAVMASNHTLNTVANVWNAASIATPIGFMGGPVTTKIAIKGIQWTTAAIRSDRGNSCSPTFCTQLVASAYDHFGFKLGKVDPSLLLPQNIVQLAQGGGLEFLGVLEM